MLGERVTYVNGVLLKLLVERAGKCCFPYYEALTDHPLRVSRLVRVESTTIQWSEGYLSTERLLSRFYLVYCTDWKQRSKEAKVDVRTM